MPGWERNGGGSRHDDLVWTLSYLSVGEDFRCGV